MAVLLAVVSAAGCVTTQPPRPEEMGAAFGRVEYVENGKEVSFGASWTRQDILQVIVRPAAGGEVKSVPVESDGSFYLELPAGKHVFVGFMRTLREFAPGAKYSVGRVMAAFSVAKGEAVYIGDVRVERGGTMGRTAIVDREENTRQRLAARLAEAALAPGKRLMRPEQPPGRFAQVTAICGGSWGIECDANHRGVRPLQPNGFAWTFPPVESVTPLLEWTRSSRARVTYDVAVYEYIYVGGPGGGLRGPVLAYAEGLEEPRYTPPALQRGERYEWSVRLRDGDTVSTWSTTSQSAVFPVLAPVMVGVGGGSSFGQYFGFEIRR
jgi:hypothetical protein